MNGRVTFLLVLQCSLCSVCSAILISISPLSAPLNQHFFLQLVVPAWTHPVVCSHPYSQCTHTANISQHMYRYAYTNTPTNTYILPDSEYYISCYNRTYIETVNQCTCMWRKSNPRMNLQSNLRIYRTWHERHYTSEAIFTDLVGVLSSCSNNNFKLPLNDGI